MKKHKQGLGVGKKKKRWGGNYACFEGFCKTREFYISAICIAVLKRDIKKKYKIIMKSNLSDSNIHYVYMYTRVFMASVICLSGLNLQSALKSKRGHMHKSLWNCNTVWKHLFFHTTCPGTGQLCPASILVATLTLASVPTRTLGHSLLHMFILLHMCLCMVPVKGLCFAVCSLWAKGCLPVPSGKWQNLFQARALETVRLQKVQTSLWWCQYQLLYTNTRETSI